MNWTLLTLMTVANGPLVNQAAAAPAAEANPAYIIAAFGLMGASALFFILELFVPSGGIFATLCGTCTIASVASR